MSTTAEKLTYLNDTKGKIKDSINLTGANIGSNDTFRSYAVKLRDGLVNVLNDNGDTIYNNFPKSSGSGSSITLNDTLEAPMRNKMFKGNTLQNGTPTPSTPIEIQSVEGIQNINVCGKNLIPTNEFTLHRTNKRTIQINFSTPLPAGTYTISWNIENQSGLTSSTSMGWALYNGTTNVGSLPQIYDGITTTSSTKTTTQQITHLYAFINSSAPSDATITINNLQIEKGETSTSYEAYTGNIYDINLNGKNLLNNTLLTEETYKTGITVTPNSDGSITVDGLATANTYFNLMNYDFGNTNFNSVDGGSSQYIASTGNSSTDVILYYNKNNKYSYIGILNGVRVDNITIYPMIRLSSISDSEYVPYRSPIKLYEGDYITGTPDNWSIVRNNKEKIFNGSEEGWTLLTTSNLNNYLIDGQINDINYVSNVINYKSNYYKGILNANRYQDNTFFVNNNKRIVFTNNSITSVNNWKTNLATNNISVVYPLATPTTEAITDTYLISQLNALYNAKSYNGQTNISVDGQLPMILEVSALKDEI